MPILRKKIQKETALVCFFFILSLLLDVSISICLLEIADLSFSASLPLLSLGKLGLLCTVHPISSVNATDLQLSSLIIIIIIVQQSSKLSLSSPKRDYWSLGCWPSNLLICKSHYWYVYLYIFIMILKWRKAYSQFDFGIKTNTIFMMMMRYKGIHDDDEI